MTPFSDRFCTNMEGKTLLLKVEILLLASLVRQSGQLASLVNEEILQRDLRVWELFRRKIFLNHSL